MPPKSGADENVPTSSGNDDGLNHHQQQNAPLYHQNDSPREEKIQLYKRRIVWRNVILYTAFHMSAVYGLYVALTQAMWATLIWTYVLYILGALGITGGAHRLWSHRSYKAKAPLRFLLMIFDCIALQNDVIEWVRDHRVHHKYSETDADPHNATRGLFFSHVGWLLVRKHPDVIKKGKTVDLSDLYGDPILVFQKRFYIPLAIFFCFIMPTLVPMYFWNESAWTAYFTAGVFRYIWTLHCTWAINSIAHIFGNRPYDKYINPRQNIFAALLSLGEGWHNYHHVFPYDYRASEMPYTINLTTVFIDFFAYIGWAYERKSISKEMVQRKMLRSGDRSNIDHQNQQRHDDHRRAVGEDDAKSEN